MSDSNKMDQADIKILSITAATKEDVPNGNPDSFAKVLFRLGRQGMTFPVFISRQFISDENMVLVARHYLHIQAKRIADATASWRLNEEDFERATKLQKSPPNISPVPVQIPS